MRSFLLSFLFYGALVFLLGLAGCVREAPVQDSQTLEYSCPGGERFVVHFTPDRAAEVTVPGGEQIRVDQVSAASGAKYENDRILYWSKGKEAMFEYQGQTFQGCLERADSHGMPSGSDKQ